MTPKITTTTIIVSSVSFPENNSNARTMHLIIMLWALVAQISSIYLLSQNYIFAPAQIHGCIKYVAKRTWQHFHRNLLMLVCLHIFRSLKVRQTISFPSSVTVWHCWKIQDSALTLTSTGYAGWGEADLKISSFKQEPLCKDGSSAPNDHLWLQVTAKTTVRIANNLFLRHMHKRF